MTPLAWFLLANTLVTAAAIALAARAWFVAGGYMRQCRCTVQAYASLVDTQPHRPVVDGDAPPVGKHAATEHMPAVGQLDGPPVYYFAEGGPVR